MITREVRLHFGIKVGTGEAKTATIREETLGDELDVADAGHVGVSMHRRIDMARVTRLGDLENPAPEIIARLRRADWELIERALRKMDAEISIEAGLTQPVEGDDAAGREEPGRAAPGDA